MTKIAAVAILAMLALVGAVSGQTTPDATVPPEQVSVAVTTAKVREGLNTRADTLLLWNRNERSLPIGHAIKTCVKAGQGDLLGRGVMNCTMSIVLPLGKLTAVGIVHNLRRYTLVITGGTGIYEGTTGPLFVRSVSGDGVRRLTFTL